MRRPTRRGLNVHLLVLRAMVTVVLLCSFHARADSQVIIRDKYLRIRARADDPLFTTYAAAKDRSRLYADKAYFMNYFTPDRPITYSSQDAGDWSTIWRIGNVVVDKVNQFQEPPVVVASFPDMAVLEYEPFAGVKVQEVFCVYSSGAAIVDLHMKNVGKLTYDMNIYSVLAMDPSDSMDVAGFDSLSNGLELSHYESPVRMFSNLYPGYPDRFRDMLVSDTSPQSYGAYPFCKLSDFEPVLRRFNEYDPHKTKLDQVSAGRSGLVVLQRNLSLAPGDSADVRFVRGCQAVGSPRSEMDREVRDALSANLQSLADADVSLFSAIPRVPFKTSSEKLIYLDAFNLVRQCMLPPSGAARRNYYVFSRNPIWGWGHGHQVMHESLSMIPYAYLDWKSAEESQRIYMDQQSPDGLIPYRVGPRGPQSYPRDSIGTTSAPFFSWTNWEIYKISRDRSFLNEAYKSGSRYVHYLQKYRDRNHDGLLEWGPNGIIENVRDDWNIIFQLKNPARGLEGRDISDEIDCLDLSSQTANEMYYLKLMAQELGDSSGVREWSRKFDALAGLINKYMWDKRDRFFYHVSMNRHLFEFEGSSLRRKEIIGFLPMWARVATKEQAAELVKELKNPKTFWRQYGIPTVAADDPDYTPFVDDCCHWNGPVWMLWDYMVMDGLEHYGYKKVADEVADRMLLAAETQLRKNHRFWESYSADFPIQQSPPNYIWDSILAKVLIEKYSAK